MIVLTYTALYREWRPKTFNDVVGQEHITTTLKNQILNNRIAHAYLFCGTRGTGKTSTAKVFAKALNCLNLKEGEPCNKCEMCRKINEGLAIDVTELDAASNNGVDKIRDIIDDVKYPPQESKYKVYIMDEVHMLSAGAVNAFLKTLEEPPNNVIFILATTDPQKLPITILSRCQRFDFKRISNEDIIKRLKVVCNESNIEITDSALNIIAVLSEGAMRDALSILERCIQDGENKIDEDKINPNEILKLYPSLIPHPIVKNVFLFDKKKLDLGKSLLFEIGAFYIFEPCSSLVNYFLNPNENDIILDMASAPGGKTTYMAEIMKNTGNIIAWDVYEHRINLINENANRLGLKNINTSINDASIYNENYKENNTTFILILGLLLHII